MAILPDRSFEVREVRLHSRSCKIIAKYALFGVAERKQDMIRLKARSFAPSRLIFLAVHLYGFVICTPNALKLRRFKVHRIFKRLIGRTDEAKAAVNTLPY